MRLSSISPSDSFLVAVSGTTVILLDFRSGVWVSVKAKLSDGGEMRPIRWVGQHVVDGLIYVHVMTNSGGCYRACISAFQVSMSSFIFYRHRLLS